MRFDNMWRSSLHRASLNRASHGFTYFLKTCYFVIFCYIWVITSLFEQKLKHSSSRLCFWVPNTWEGQAPKPKPLTLYLELLSEHLTKGVIWYNYLWIGLHSQHKWFCHIFSIQVSMFDVQQSKRLCNI